MGCHTSITQALLRSPIWTCYLDLFREQSYLNCYLDILASGVQGARQSCGAPEWSAKAKGSHLELLEAVVLVMQGLKASLDGGLVQRELPVELHSLGQGV